MTTRPESEFKWNWNGEHLLITEYRIRPELPPYPNYEVISVMLTREAAEQLRDNLLEWLADDPA